MSTLKSECRKFSPNVFNKAKCQNCFRTKNAHSAEALENNRASRNVSKCGYLFVAPDWDFNVSVNRTKRWQRRWFVLYDDGELTYALDEFPDTIPQGTIDMNKVLDVSDAESATGNEFSISITTPDKVHFVKGTSKEESKWWFDVLSRVLPRHLSRGKHKRNATFPCGKATIPTTAVIAQDYCSEDDIRVNNYSRPKFLSSSEIPQIEKDWIQSVDAEEDEDVFPANDAYPNENNSDDENVRDVQVNNALNKLISQSEETQEESEGQSNHGDDKIQKDCLSQLEELDARRRNRRYLKRENRIQRNQRSRIDGVSKMIPSKNRQDKIVMNELSDPTPNSNGSAIAAAEKLEYLESIHANEDRPHSARQNIVPDEKEKPSSTEESNSKDFKNKQSRKTNLRKSESLKNIPSETQSEIRDHVSGLRRYHSFKSSSCHRKIKQNNGTSSLKKTKLSSTALSRTATSSPTTAVQSLTPDTKSNSDIKPSSPDICYEHTSEGVFMRTGWLMRQTLSKDWSRHWFVLRDSSLTYYRDPSAEHCGIMDGILDLNQVSTIRDTETDRYYAFSLRMWDGKKHILAAETDDFRSMWIQGLQYASNLWSSASKEDFICSEIVLPEHTFHHADRSVERISSPSSLSSLPYVYDNSLAETSSSSDDQSEYFSLVDEDEVSDLSSSPRTLPPSPPINRNMISLVKEKSRSRSSSSPKSCLPTTDADCTISCDGINGSNGKYIDSNLSHYTDTLDSMQQDDGVDISELSTQLLNGDHIISSMKLSADPPVQHSEDAEYTQFSLEFDDQLSKEHEDQTEADSRNLNGPICKPFRSELCNTSTSKSEITDECRMCIIVKSKLIAAKEEIRKLKKELKEAHENFDNLEMFSYKLAQDIKVKEENYNAQIALMTAKIDDLTYKFTLAEKNYRQLKQKTLKSENKERKRSSLKNREGLSLTKEYELKLCDLEKKIGYIETTIQREPSSAEDFENTRTDSQPKVEESSSLPSELSDASTSTEVSSSSTKGFFSRLQSLGSRVQTVNDLVSEKNTSNKESKTPKIRLERDTEGSSKFDESDESWSLSLNHSLKNSNKYREKHPSNLSDCHSVFNRKIHKILKWLKTSLDGICKQKNKNNLLMDEKIVLIQNLIDLLDSFCSNIHPHNEQKPIQNKTCHTILLAYEAMRLLEKMEDIDSIDSLVRLDVTQLAFKVILRTLCTAFAEYENSELSNTLQLISKIPQIRFFCPIVNKLFPESAGEIHQFDSVSERLQQLHDQHTFILDILQRAKKVKYECLWNILTDVPVQDANVNKPQSLSSILNYVTSIATGIYRIAELQLSGEQHQSPYILKTEQEKVQTWCLTANNELKNNLTSFLDELKEQCPMIHESSVPLFELSDAKRKEITCYVSELSFFSVSYSVLNSLLSYPLKDIDTHDNDLPSSVLHGVDRFDNISSASLNRSITFDNTDFFRCQQCTTLNNFLSYSNQDLNWSEYIEKYNFYHPRRSECLNFKLENLATNLSSTCSNCDSHFPEPAGNNLKDVCNNLTCAECDNWIKKFCASEKQHEMECQALELKYNSELQQLEECLIKSSEVHEQEMLQKETELESTTAQLQRLKMEYEEQIQTLKDLYEQKLHFDCDNIDEGSIRQAYKSEIEDLKDMFKKGLVAIENSHYRITTEMEKKHKDEISILRAEKERALELEAQATVTALEAIKKSHQQQLKEETAIIKEDLMRKFRSDEPYGTFYDKYGSDLEKLKAEILKITNMYSAKCVENIALEEKVNSLRHQLEDAHNELCSLLKKNKEIDTSLVQV